MVARLIILVSLMLLSFVASAKGLTVRVDRNQLALGEQLELTLTLPQSSGSQRPDLRELLKDFRVDGQSQSYNYNNRNGVVSLENNIQLLLSPNRQGKLVIPAFSVGTFSSDPIQITVTEQSAEQSTSDDVLIEIEVSPSNPYVQSQIAYIQRLYYSRPLLGNASITKPRLSKGDADIQFWGASDPRYVTHKNRPYRLVERYYLVYPRNPGVLEFEPSVFNGSLASSQQRNNFRMNLFRKGTRVNASSEKASLVVKGKPSGYSAEHWLPASQVTLSINLSQPADSLKVGEPLTVTVGLMAEGLKAEVLPEVAFDLPDNIKSYPEKSVFRTDKIANGMVGLRQEKIVLIANEVGEYTIPEVTIPWWNVAKDELQEVKLKKMVLKVAVGDQVLSSKSQPLVDDVVEVSAIDDLVKNDITPDGAVETDDSNDKARPLFVRVWSGFLGQFADNKVSFITGLLGLLGLIGVVCIALKRRNQRLRSGGYQRQQALAKALYTLETACQKNNPKEAIGALPSWAEAVGIYPATILGVESSDNLALSSAVTELVTASYSPVSESWSGEKLLQAIRGFAAPAARQQQPEAGSLKPLHPC